LLQVLIQLHNEREAAAVAAVQGRPDEPVWQLNDPAVLQALGFQDGTCLTAEQVCVAQAACLVQPGSAGLIHCNCGSDWRPVGLS